MLVRFFVRYSRVKLFPWGGTRIVEIETDPDDDSTQHTAFRRSAGQTGANFYGRVVDNGGNRRTRFE